MVAFRGERIEQEQSHAQTPVEQNLRYVLLKHSFGHGDPNILQFAIVVEEISKRDSRNADLARTEIPNRVLECVTGIHPGAVEARDTAVGHCGWLGIRMQIR